MIVDAPYPKDIRVRKEAESLQKAGKKVLVVCPNYNNQRREIINGVEVLRLGTNYTKFKKGVFDVIESVFNINLFFYFGIRKAFKLYQIDFLHVHDLPLAGTGYMFRNKVGKLILDLHENYPEALQIWFIWNTNRLKRWKNSVFMNYKRWVAKEEKYCKRYDYIICVVEEMKEKIASNFNISEEKMLVVSNQEETSFLENSEVTDTIDPEAFSITYIGGIGPHRGIDTVIKSMKQIVSHIPEAKFYIIGSGNNDTMNFLKELSKDNGVSDNVIFESYKPFNEIASIMNKSNINIIPHNKSGHTDNTIPHKLFQIMLSKGLLLVSSCAPLQRIVKKYDAGYIFQADNENNLAEVVVSIHKEHNSLKDKIINAYKAAFEIENWEEESGKLINFYASLN